jgi:carbon storage regulator
MDETTIVGHVHHPIAMRADTDHGLILGRKVDEQFRIGDDVVIRVIEIKGGKVRLLIKAPKHIAVNREEVYQAAKAQQTGR